MAAKTLVDSDLAPRTRRANGKPRRHKLPVCDATGLPRYRDRHQARDGARTLSAGERNYETSTFACPDCRGFHIEKTFHHAPIAIERTESATAFSGSLSSRKRRYWITDIENLTHGAQPSCMEAAALWSVLTQEAPGVASHDHVVIGAARHVVRKYRAAINGANVKWVVGADAPDGADRALLAAVDLHRVARNYDELVIASGDGAFAELARRAKVLGLTVHVITTQHPKQRTSLSRELATIADRRTLVRLQPRKPKRNNLVEIAITVPRTHRRAHIDNPASVAD